MLALLAFDNGAHIDISRGALPLSLNLHLALLPEDNVWVVKTGGSHGRHRGRKGRLPHSSRRVLLWLGWSERRFARGELLIIHQRLQLVIRVLELHGAVDNLDLRILTDD